MALQFSVLASGSRGNSTLVAAAGAGVLIDVGLGPRSTQHRLEQVGSSWHRVAAALLTHTHGDHVKPDTLRTMVRERIPFYCHEGHDAILGNFRGFRALDRLGLVHRFDDQPFLVPPGFRVEAIPLSHDGGPTFGFRVEGRSERRGRTASVGYIADTGIWTADTAEALTDSDLIAIEFNHDVAMQRQSGRPQSLIRRVLGDHGHLSNEQGAALVEEILKRSSPGNVRHLVLLHLSQQCNEPRLALSVARAMVRASGRRITVHAADQDSPSPHLELTPRRASRSRPISAASRAESQAAFPWELPDVLEPLVSV